VRPDISQSAGYKDQLRLAAYHVPCAFLHTFLEDEDCLDMLRSWDCRMELW
jgi:hypothetical protein